MLTGEEAAARLKEHGQEIDEDTDDDAEKDKGEQQSAKKQGTLKFKEKGTDNDTVGVAPAAAIEGERPKKQLGPMAPPKEMLEEMQRQQRELADEGFGFGPPPPDIVEFLDSKSSENRAATARRVISILKNDGDAYDVLSASPEHSNAELKKVYWKLSLVIHPDKCDDPCAAAAFDATVPVGKAQAMFGTTAGSGTSGGTVVTGGTQKYETSAKDRTYYFHFITLTGLKPRMRYYYTVGIGASSKDRSTEFSFRAPHSHADPGPTTLDVYGGGCAMLSRVGVACRHRAAATISSFSHH